MAEPLVLDNHAPAQQSPESPIESKELLSTLLDAITPSTVQLSFTQTDDFHRWRPRYHLVASRGWMNDPCGLGFDPATGLYHVAFQWNERGNDWGNISWCSSISRDLVSWEVSTTSSLKPDEPYDRCGVFTGCLVQPGLLGDSNRKLTSFYTSASDGPIHYTLSYKYGSESLSMASSDDGGKTWHKHPNNPLISGPPTGMDVTGWRDPFVARWPALSELVGDFSESMLFACISGGIKGCGPAAFLYSVDGTDLKAWRYLGLLAHFGPNKCLSRWSGDLGVNWEVVNFFTLHDKFKRHSVSFLTIGCEGRLLDHNSSEIGDGLTSMVRRTSRSQLWIAGACGKGPTPNCQSGMITHEFGGILDHGCYYAANSFFDPLVEGQVVMGWITEEDLPDDLRHRQRWSGLLSIPRLLRLVVMTGLVRARSSALEDITSIQAIPDAQGRFTVLTLGIEPHPNMRKLRSSGRLLELSPFELVSTASDYTVHQNILKARSHCWELETEITVSRHCKVVGFEIGHTRGKTSSFSLRETADFTDDTLLPTDFTALTKVYLDLQQEELIIDRSDVRVSDSRINRAPEIAAHTLFTTYDATVGQEIEESLHIRTFYDTSVLEVFANGRSVISTRIYPDSKRCFGIRFYAESEADKSAGTALARVASARLWDGLA